MDNEKKDWLSDRVRVKIANLKNPGDDIFCSVNGNSFLIKDGEIVNVPRAVVNVLKEAHTVKWTVDGEMGKRTQKQKIIPKFFVVEIDEEKQPEKDDKVDMIKKIKLNERKIKLNENKNEEKEIIE